MLRLSGPAAGPLVARRLGLPERCGEPASERPRGVLAGRFDDHAGGIPCLWFWMPGPASFTREDVSELHLPGSPPLVEAVLEALVRDGARLAEPGEFTRRAFESGRIDLTRAEGVLGLIEASDLAAARSAAQLLLGGLERRVAELRAGLEGLRMLAEASLDFDSTETGHVEAAALAERAEQLRSALAEALRWEQRRQASRGRPRIVLAGRPNAGKSSLFNLLVAGGPADLTRTALVSDLAGSTRDGKAAPWLVAGVEVELFDAPGFELQLAAPAGMGDDPDAKAQELALQARRGADVLLWALSIEEAEAALGDRDRLPTECQVLPVLTKCDLDPGAALPAALASALRVSSLADPEAARVALETRVAEALGLDTEAADEAPRLADAASLGRELSARHRAALELGLEALDEAREGLALGMPLDLIAETLRAATQELDGITGETTPEDLLDRIFAGFCLGK